MTMNNSRRAPARWSLYGCFLTAGDMSLMLNFFHGRRNEIFFGPAWLFCNLYAINAKSAYVLFAAWKNRKIYWNIVANMEFSAPLVVLSVAIREEMNIYSASKGKRNNEKIEK